MNSLQKACYVLRYFGPRWIATRMRLALRQKLGLAQRAFGERPWTSIDLAAITLPGTPAEPERYARFKRDHSPPFLFPLGEPPTSSASLCDVAGERHPTLAERLDLLRAGRCVCFFRQPSPGPIDWNANPFTGQRSDPARTWTELSVFSPNQGDLRTLWEPSRAAWALDLTRAQARHAAPDVGELFWRWVDSWMAACPPYRGPQWMCGQESSVRLIAIATAFWSLADDPATTPQRWQQFARLAWATGYRVAHHIDYAISQKNNHGLSEACGLIVVSQLFPEFREAAAWRALGRRVLAQELRRQLYADGSYVQHSMNYHRVMLHVSLLALRLAELAGDPFERDLYEHLGRAGDFLFEMMDPTTGRLPQYGHNDGADVLALSECDFNDYRPVIQATHYLVHRRRLLPAGPWDEDLLWLFGAEALAAPSAEPRQPRSRAFDDGGYYTLRTAESWAMLRCHTYRDRPSHTDALHLDLWWRGVNVLCDCGTYQYYTPEQPALAEYFPSLAAHNTVEIDGREPAERASRFLTFPWPRACMRNFATADGAPLSFEGEHYAYDRAPWHVLHRRLVIALAGDAWIVVDDLLGTGAHSATLRWHLADAPFEVNAADLSAKLRCAAGDVHLAVASHPQRPSAFEILRGLDTRERVQGFAAPYYAERLPIPTLEVSLAGTWPARIVTAFGLGAPVSISLGEEHADAQSCQVKTGAAVWTLQLSAPDRCAQRILLNCASASPVK